MSADEDKNKKTKRRPKGTGGLYQDGKGLWVGIVTVPGKNGKPQQIRRASKNKTIAERKLRDLQVKVATGKVKVASPDDPTVAVWLEKWINEVRADDLRPKTIRDYKSTITNYINPHIGTVKLDKLTADHVRKMIRGARGAKGLQTRNAQKAWTLLRRAIDDAIKEELTEKNPARLVRKPPHIPQERGAYDEETAKLLLAKAIEIDEGRETGPFLATRWATAFLTGARQAECMGLTWDRVDLDSAVIDISWQLQRHTRRHGCGDPPTCGKKGPAWCPHTEWDLPAGFEYVDCHRSLIWTRPKTNKGTRWVPITPALLELLKVYKRQQAGVYNPHNLLWHHDDGRPMSQEEDNRAWNGLIAACGIKKQRGEALLHEARNTAATQLLEEGTDVRVIQEILGHAHILTTREYQTVSLDFARKAVKGLGKLLPA